MTITYSIRNVTSELVKSVMLRKFFQMVFVGNDKKSLHIYTATILGASGEVEVGSDGKAEINENFISDLYSLKQFRMRFEFAVGNNDSNEVLSIEHKDITSDAHGFMNEIDCIHKVWGNDCRILQDDQREILKKLEEITSANIPSEELAEVTAGLSEYRLLWTEQKKSGLSGKYFKSLSVPGKCTVVEDAPQPNLRDGIALKKAYAISVPEGMILPKGIELVNWVRTTIDFKYPLDESNLNYIIKKDVTEDGNTAICAPDFTWYFSPVVKSFIDNRNCMVEIKRGTQGNREECTCPIQKQRHVFYSSDKYQNSIDTVPNKLTVNFHYWTHDEKINSRQKYRLSARDVLPTPQAFADVAEINIFLDMADEHNRGNRQFILGIFISFILAYGIDSARLKEIQSCFEPLTQIFAADVWWILFMALFSLTLMNQPARLGNNSRPMAFFRKALLAVSMVWVFVVFAIVRSQWFCYIPRVAIDIVYWSVRILFIVLILLHFIYWRKNKINGKDSLLTDLFGKDVL